MSARNASISWVTRTRCSWVSSQNAPGPQDLGKDWDERPPGAAGVVVEVGETRTGLGPPGYRPGIQSEPDNREARPRLRARGPSRRPPQVAGHQVCPA